MLSKGKCDKDHTPIDDYTKENKALWVPHVNSSPGIEFNDKTVKSLKKEGTDWVAK